MYDYIIFTTIFIYLIFCIGVFVLSAILRKNPIDKILLSNIVMNYIIAFIVAFAFFIDQIFLIDIAIIFALINFIVAMVFSKFFTIEEKVK